LIVVVAATEKELDASGAADTFCCGIGPAESGIRTAMALAELRPDAVLHVGIAGAAELPPLSVVIGTEAFYADIVDPASQMPKVERVYPAPGLIEAFASRVEDGLARWPEEGRERVHVVFSAHSLPLRVLSSGDPYGEQCLETARLVAERTGLSEDRWSWSWQSAGRSPEPWAGPDLGDHLEELASRGVRDVVSVPVGFVSDHVELLFDIDVRAQGIASELGMRLERPPALNDDPMFVETLAELVRERAEHWFEGAEAA